MPKDNHKYVFVIGGVMSGVGKGITTPSIGSILQDKRYRVNLLKADPYLNVDAGLMSPTEHGEAFVLSNGLETDQDMGNYERFLNRDQAPEDYITSGMVYREVIERERRGEYGGKCVEAMPHIRDEIIGRLRKAADKNDSDISIVEIGGTVGDYQNAMFIEAARVLKIYNPKNVLFVLVTYLPIPNKIGEMKTKPTQNAVRQLNSYGVQADVLIARSEVPLDQIRKEKLAMSCNVYPERVISAPDIDSIYDVPINFEKDSLGDLILSELSLEPLSENGLVAWKKFVEKTKNTNKKVRIAVVGKYFSSGDFVLSDAYVSVLEAIKFSAYELGAEPEIDWLDASEFVGQPGRVEVLRDYDGVIVPGGFGAEGATEMLEVIRFVREEKIPFFGIGYGMQLALVEYAQNVLGIKDANTYEVDENTASPVVIRLEEMGEQYYTDSFRKMRLGSHSVELAADSMIGQAYGKESISERFRHIYAVNPVFYESFTDAGVRFSGLNASGELAEAFELPETEHPFFLGTQFHPEFQARPLSPHPLFTAFLRTCLGE